MKASGMDNTRYKILLIEDDKLDQMAFKRLVETESLPYDYTIASSVSEAQSILASEQFDAVIADYRLGDGTAFDVLNSVKNTPIIFVTGTGSEEVAVKSWRAGAYDYLTKDVDRNYLKAVPITVKNAIEHKRLKEILDQKQKNLEAIFDAVPIGMLLVDENMIIKRVNDAIRQIAGREYLQIINQQVGDALGCINSTYNEKGCGYSPACAECPLRKAIKSVLDSGRPVHELKIRPTLKVDNKEITLWLCINAEPAATDGRKNVVVAIDDITKRKKAEEKVKEAMEVKSQFITTVSHDLRTPLANMKEGIAIVLDGVVGEINDEQRNFLDIAKRNINRLTMLINDVLDFQKLEAGEMGLDIQQNNIQHVIGEAYKTMAISAKKKGIDLSLELADDLPRASFDRDKISQVSTNLISNAIKFTPEQGQVSVCVQQQGQDWTIAVNDTGVGIPKDELPKIFDRFYRVHRPGKQIQGTGLGLTIVKKIVTMHGGRIEVKSEIDQGTTFTVFLPLAVKSIPEVLPEKTDELLESNLANKARTK